MVLLSVPLPKLNIVAVNKLFGPLHDLGIIGAVERNSAVKMAI